MILADDLLRSVKRAITVPASQPLLQDPDFYELMDEIISSRVVPLLESLDEEYFITESTVALVDNQQDYDIPYRAIGRGLRDLLIEDSSGNRRSIPKISIEDAQQVSVYGDILGFHFMGDRVRLLPRFTTAPSSTIKMLWRLPPSKLQAASAAAKVASISTGATETTYTCTTVPSTITSSTPCDIGRAKSGSPILAMDKTPTSVSGTQIVFAVADVPSGVAVGDYISLAGCSPVIQNVPNEMLALLRSYASYRVLVAIGDFDAGKVVAEDISIEEKNIKSLLQPRIEGEPTIIINRQGLVRGNRIAAHRRFWYGL